MIDTAHAWAYKTVQGMSNVLKKIDKFFHTYSLPSIHQQLSLPILEHPPLDISIPLFWSMEHYTTVPSQRSREEAPSWNAARVQRSAISLYTSWWAAFCTPSTFYKDKDLRLLSDPHLGPAGNILSHMTAKGIASRLGTESRPSQALNQQHIIWNQKARSQYLQQHVLSNSKKYKYIAAQCAELLLWLGWLRSSEVFNLRIADSDMTPPLNHGRHNLPPGVGAILLRLLPSTKTNRDKQADMVIAWKTSGGLCPGHWLTYLFHIMKTLKWYDPNSFIFRCKEYTLEQLYLQT